MKYHYYAVFEKTEEGYNIYYPDLPGCLSCAETIDEALYMSKDALEGYLLISEEDGDELKEPSSYYELSKKLKKNEMLQLVVADTDFVRLREMNKSVNKMVTLPKWIIELGKEKKLNFSQILQNALKKELDID
jgi:toxin-antitoxin system, antitoxin component, hicB family